MKQKLTKAAIIGSILLWLAAAVKLGWMVYEREFLNAEPPAIEQPVP